MENQVETNDKKSRPKFRVGSRAVRVGPATAKALFNTLAKINKKDFGKKVRPEALISLLIGLLEPEHITQLQDASLSNMDRMEREYQAYVTKNGAISKDAFIGTLLSGELKSNSNTEQITNKD